MVKLIDEHLQRDQELVEGGYILPPKVVNQETDIIKGIARSCMQRIVTTSCLETIDDKNIDKTLIFDEDSQWDISKIIGLMAQSDC